MLGSGGEERAVILLPYIAGSSGGMTGGVLEAGVVLGLTLAGAVKWGLRFAWRRLSAPEGKRRGAHRASC
jgi:hypothetical protein